MTKPNSRVSVMKFSFKIKLPHQNKKYNPMVIDKNGVEVLKHGVIHASDICQ